MSQPVLPAGGVSSLQIIRGWILLSAVLMVVGAFGPWVKALGQSASGTDGSNDGWLVVGAAVLGCALFFAMRKTRVGGVWPLLAGIAGLAVTLYDRNHLNNAINRGGPFAQAVAQIGWGLNLALAASISLGIAGVVYFFQRPEAQPPTVPASPSPLNVPPSPPPTTPPTGDSPASEQGTQPAQPPSHPPSS